MSSSASLILAARLEICSSGPAVLIFLNFGPWKKTVKKDLTPPKIPNSSDLDHFKLKIPQNANKNNKKYKKIFPVLPSGPSGLDGPAVALPTSEESPTRLNYDLNITLPDDCTVLGWVTAQDTDSIRSEHKNKALCSLTCFVL